MCCWPRSIATRSAAGGLAQLRFGVFAGVSLGAIAGLMAYRRLPGPALSWVAAGAATGGLTAAGALDRADRVRPAPRGAAATRWVGGVLALAVAGWSAADLATDATTSPATWLGRFAISPLGWRTGGLIGVAVALAAAVAGFVQRGRLFDRSGRAAGHLGGADALRRHPA